MTDLDTLAQNYRSNPSDKKLNVLLTLCMPIIKLRAGKVCAARPRWDRDECVSFLSEAVWGLLRKYPKMKQPTDNFNFNGLLYRHLEWATKTFARIQLAPTRRMILSFGDVGGMHKLPDSVNVSKKLADKDFVSKIREQCAPRLQAVIDLHLKGISGVETARILDVAISTIPYRLSSIKKIALKLLQPPSVRKNELRCSMCLEWLPKNEFGLNKSHRAGRSYWCKKCHKVKYKERKAKRKAHLKAYSAAYRAAHKEEIKVSAKEYYKLNKDKFKKYAAAYRQRKRAQNASG